MWHDILKQLGNKNTAPQKADHHRVREKHRYYFTYHDIEFYLTTRESEIVCHLLLGKTMVVIARETHLSARTVEFYIENIKKKLACRKRKELIAILTNSNFLSKTDTRNKAGPL